MSTAVITGAFSNTGTAVATELIERGWQVETLTNRRVPAGSSIKAHPLHFDAAQLADSLRGANVLINTYWVRFPHRGMSFERAVANSLMLFEAAKRAGLSRIVQVSVSNARVDCGLAYYEGKARVDAVLSASGMSSAIVRPTLIVGPRDVLTNNIAWFIRRFPVFAIPSGAGYRLQPITLDDVGRIIADAAESTRHVEVDAAGPEEFTFIEYVQLLASALGRSTRLVRLPPRVVTTMLAPVNRLLHDTVLTHEELEGLRRNMLVSDQPPLGHESVSDWLTAHGSVFGERYVNDTVNRFRSS